MNKTEETTELVHSMEDNKAFDYGATDHCKGNHSDKVAETSAASSHGHSCSVNMNSTDRKLLEASQQNQDVSDKKPCSCTENDGICYCGERRKGIRLEPWAPIKSVALVSSLGLFLLWIVVIASLGAKNKL